MIARYCAAILLLFAGTGAMAGARTVGESDYQRIVSLSSPAISPDGKLVAAIASRVIWNDDRRSNELLLVDTGTGSTRTFFAGRKGLDEPAFSPNGSLLAFLAEDAKSHTQIYVMRPDGSGVQQVTHVRTDVDTFAWRHDGGALAYTATDPEPVRKGADRFRDSFLFTTEPITARSRPRPSHVFVQTLSGGAPVQLTFGERDTESPSWSPDGRSIAVVVSPNAIGNDQSFSRIGLVDVRSKRLRYLTHHTAWEATPLFSPDGKSIAYTYSNGDSQVNLSRIYVTTPAGGAGTMLAGGLDRTVNDLVWSADGKSMIVTVPDGLTNAIYRAAIGASNLSRLDVADVVPGTPGITTGTASSPSLLNAVSRDGSIAFIGTSTARPMELFVRRADGATVQLTHVNASLASSIQWAHAQRITFPTTMGITADGVLYTPPHFDPHRRYPTVVYIHGGPTDPSMRIFDFWAQLMAARGWLVLRPNYRGSPNLGLAYQRGVLYDPEEGPGKDIMSALDAVRARGIVDDSRIAVCGWSYGGIMTAWLISKYHIWRAAVSGASVNDWITDYGTADDSLADVDLMHGSPFVGDNAKEWRAVSAITYVKDVTTPVLILSDIGDNRDPFATSSMYWRALRDNHKDATLRTWPVDGHFPDDPVRTVDVYHYWIDYIAQHFK
jgi:dipeptidyl aminopeptidase/acylaminoacyl peptidase